MDAIHSVLGRDILGLYLYGSAVVGGLKPRSDLDIFAVVQRPTTREAKQRLFERISPLSGSTTRAPGWRPLEVTIVVESEVRPWRYPPVVDFQYGEWLRDDFANGKVEPASPTNPDLAVVATMVHQSGEALAGPPATEILDPVPHADLARAMRESLGSLLADLDDDTRNVVLTLARMWSTMVTGTIRSKDEAAAWAGARLPDEEHRSVLSRARAIYLGEAVEQWDDLEGPVRSYAAQVVHELERLA